MTRHTIYQRLELASPSAGLKRRMKPFIMVSSGGGKSRSDTSWAASILPETAWQHDDQAAFRAAFPDQMAQYQLVANLGMRMLTFDEPSSTAPKPVKPIATMPAGYTYLGQLIAHDLTFNTELIPKLGAEGEIDGNLRRPMLALATLYGGGPKAFPIGYSPTTARLTAGGIGSRLKFRVGTIACPHGTGSAPDLPRLSADKLGSLDGNSATMDKRATEVLIADGRNDDHAIIAQLAALFMTCHNRVVDAVSPGTTHKPLGPFDQIRIFERARAATIYLYRLVVWNDYLRRLLYSEVYERYAPQNLMDEKLPPAIKAQTVIGCHEGTAVPVEFSHAAFRFGHAMIRRDYPFGAGDVRFDIEDVLKRSSNSRPDLLPVDARWIVDWRAFFGANGTKPAVPSRPIAPTVTAIGPEALFVMRKDDGREHDTPILVTKWGNQHPAYGLAIHDLIRSFSEPCAAVADIIRFMRTDKTLRDIVDQTPILNDQDARASLIQSWLDKDAPFGGHRDVVFSEAEVRFASTHPPLYLFVLIEAAHLHEGRRLGPVGSFVIAETLAACCGGEPALPDLLQETEAASPDAAPPETSQVISDLKAAWGTSVPRTMGELVEQLTS